MMTEPLLFLVGATGSGKSRIALALAPALDAEVLSMDSMSVYAGMNLGTAKPDESERRAVKHHLLDLVEPDRAFSVADYLEECSRVLNELAGLGRRGLFVGGTVLYMKTLISGLFEGPPADAALRSELKRRAECEGTQALHDELRRVDPEGAERIHPNDLKRIVRALEVYRLTHKPISAWQEQWKDTEGARAHVMVGLDWDRDELYRRIDRRVLEMFKKGLVDEVASLLSQYGRLGPTACKAVGYSEVLDHLAGKATLPETIERVQTHTRQFAKRQLTWLRQFSEIRWVRMSPERSDQDAVEEVLAAFRKGLSGTARD